MAKRTFILKKPREAVRLRAKYIERALVKLRIVVRAQKAEPIAENDPVYGVIK